MKRRDRVAQQVAEGQGGTLERSMRPPQRYMGYYTALAIVVANMVGTGVFTTLGFQAVAIHTGAALLALWAVGGLVALCGALSYGELAAALPRSGGEYHFLSHIYHPALGVVAGAISVTVGFSAPIALAAMALGRYAATFLPVSPMGTAIAAIVIVTAFHAVSVRVGQRFQVVTTILKLLLIIVFCAAGLTAARSGDVSYAPSAETLNELFSPAFAVSLIYVSYAFSGWNAATYVAGEVIEPQQVVPRALLHGTVLVTTLYLLLNYVFLQSVPLGELAGRVEVGALAAAHIFGGEGGAIISAMLCLLLISTISAMVLAGPRVVQVIGEDLVALRPLAVRTRAGAPVRAVLLQSSLAILFVATDSFEGVLSYTGFTLSVFALLTVAGVIVLRLKSPALDRPYRVWGYPFTPVVFIAVSAVTLIVMLRERPVAAFAGLATILGSLMVALARPRTDRLG